MKIAIGAIIGAAIGFAVGYFGKCTSGMCPLTSNPIPAALFGGLFGAIIASGKY